MSFDSVHSLKKLFAYYEVIVVIIYYYVTDTVITINYKGKGATEPP